ncbi:MAG: YkuS family protein [Syntrophomonas sp.]|jgi:hypothetical protein|uniref:YkuS family protein n=1 Tax=Syntrophomonas sp. TaxID=2053627 RepID=UPI002620AAF8|nr:YkuS family protein [Syntrophomonas sp.]MDD2510277.1 YkuS family protein [Syntrophomonas sp.]MDD3879840.1 YkuS family protein [Syntrophomonas sp.]MDD4626460.1 YkuS family protein [Syntrophomonas sp.]
MEKVIAVENNLTPIKEYLEARGCLVVDVGSGWNIPVDAVVISGLDKNLMGMQDIVTIAPVIEARGKTPEEVWDSISR